MNGLDAALGAVVLVAALLGLVAGIVRLALGLLSLVVAAVAAVGWAEPAARLVARRVASPELALLLGFGAVFAGVLVVFAILAALLRRALRRLGVGWVDRALGATLASAGALAAFALVAAAGHELRPGSKLLAGSAAARAARPVVEVGLEALPEGWRREGRRRLAALAGQPSPTPPGRTAGTPPAPGGK